MRKTELILIALLSLLALYIIVNLPAHWSWKFALGVLSMYLVGQFMIKRYNLSGEHGLILFKSKKGLDLVKRLARHESFWRFFVEVGAVTSYGAFAFILLHKKPSIKAAIAGFILLTLLMGVVGPFVMPFLANTIGINIEEKAIKQSVGLPSALSFLPLLLVYGGGIFAVLFSSVILYGLVILVALQNALFVGADEMSKITPGVAPLLPGVNLPFIEGIIALIIILVVHEGAHAILAYIARVPILSSGIVLFGIIPVGAFVEPDEGVLRKKPKELQTLVLIAGPTANLIVSLLFFILFIGFVYAVNPSLEKGAITALKGSWQYSIYMVLGLSFSLNFAIGTINLLPLPVLDGYRTLEVNMKNKVIVDIMMALTVAAFLVNLLPWLFR